MFGNFVEEKSQSGNGGNLKITTTNGNISAESLNTYSFSEMFGSAGDSQSGDGGEIEITTTNGSIQGKENGEDNQTQITTFSIAQPQGESGRGGQLTQRAKEDISNFDIVTLSATGESGSVNIESTGNNLTLQSVNVIASVLLEIDNPLNPNNPIILDINNVGQSGDVNITALNDLTLDNTTIRNDANGSEPAGNVTVISQGDILFRRNSSINSNSNSSGAAGNIEITTSDSLTIEAGSDILAETTNFGNGGNISLYVPQINLGQDAEVSASTSGQGQGGNLIVRSNTPLTIQGPGQLSVETGEQDSGPAGALTLEAPSITLDDGIKLSANSDSVQAGGTVTITSPRDIRLNNNSVISSSANNEGDAGNIDITSERTLTIDTNSEILAGTTSEGEGGNITLNAEQINLGQEAEVSASTSGAGQGGSLLVHSDTPLTIQGPGQLSVSAQGENSGAAGILTLDAPFAILDNGVQLSATSESDQGGGNLNFTIDEALILQQGSLINAESTNPNSGDGGNITIDTDFLIAIPNENNDIIANAVGGNGGRIEINANSIFGLTERSGLTTEELRAQPTSDLSASSTAGIQGDVVLNTLDVDPSQGLTELPADLTDRSNQITAGCGIDNTNTQSTFVITGSGGLPASPSDAATANLVNVPWVTYTDDDATTATETAPTHDVPLVEAQQIAIDQNGNAYFVASAPDSTSSGLPHGAQCAASAASSQ